MANPRKLRLIYKNESKSDRVDAEYLARLGRLDPSLLAPCVTGQPRRRRTWPSFAAACAWFEPAPGLSATPEER